MKIQFNSVLAATSLGLATLLTQNTVAQNFALKYSDTVVFYGDSITAQRLYTRFRRGLRAHAICACPHGTAQQPTILNAGPNQDRANDTDPLGPISRLMAIANFREAESELHAYLVNNPGSAQARYMLAYSLLRQDQPKSSLTEYTRAAALVPPTAEQLRYVGQDYVLLGDYPDAGKWMLRSVQTDPADAENWYALGRLRYSEQQYPEAADCFKHALSLTPKSVKIENNLGLAYEGMNRLEEAVAAYRQAIVWQDADATNKPSEQPLLNLAIELIREAKSTDALPLLQEAFAIAPHDPRILEELGKLYMERNSYEAAQIYLAEAVRLDPGKSNLHFLLGQAYRHLGRQQDAKDEFAISTRLASSEAHQ